MSVDFWQCSLQTVSVPWTVRQKGSSEQPMFALLIGCTLPALNHAATAKLKDLQKQVRT
jgi:hypothetical protein